MSLRWSTDLLWSVHVVVFPHWPKPCWVSSLGFECPLFGVKCWMWDCSGVVTRWQHSQGLGDRSLGPWYHWCWPRSTVQVGVINAFSFIPFLFFLIRKYLVQFLQGKDGFSHRIITSCVLHLRKNVLNTIMSRKFSNITTKDMYSIFYFVILYTSGQLRKLHLWNNYSNHIHMQKTVKILHFSFLFKRLWFFCVLSTAEIP